MKISRYSVLLFALLALCCACSKEPMENPDGAVTKTILYSATVSHGPQTRATLSGSEFADDCYVFQNGDKLYVEYRDGVTLKLYGVLDLFSGAGTGTGRFEGELKCLNDFTPTNEIVLSATLVGPNAADGFFSFKDHEGGTSADEVIDAVNYPATVPYNASLADYVQKYSHFTGTSTYAAKDFANLTQQSVFLQFNLSNFRKNDLADPSATTVNVLIKDGSTTLHTVTGVPIGNNAYYGNASFSTVVQAGNAFAGAKIQIDDNLEDTHDPLVLKQGFSNDLNLETNHYYSVSRNLLDWFRIIALGSGSITITGSGGYAGVSAQYSSDGENWYAFTAAISVTENQVVYIRATRPSSDTQSWKKDYANISCSAAYKIAGDIASLLVGADFEDGEYTLPAKYTFVNQWTDDTNLVDAYDLVLSPLTLYNSCYKSMFENCTSLVHGPRELPATTLAKECYRNMFRGCTSLISSPIIGHATTRDNNNNWYQRMFAGCSSLSVIVFLDHNTYVGAAFKKNNEVGWVNGVSGTGTFYVSDQGNPFGDNRGDAYIPSGWTVTTYTP